MQNKPNLIIIEDHPVMREGLAAWFAKTGRWNVRGTAASLEEAKKLLTVTPADILLLDIQLEDGWGLDIIPWLAKQDTLAKQDKRPLTAVYSTFNDYAHVRAALSLGVQAYITKRRNEQDLEEALQKTLAGETYIDDTALYKVDTFKNHLKLLSGREMEIFTLVKQKQTNKQIAAELGISRRTVENILSCVYGKIGVRSRYELENL